MHKLSKKLAVNFKRIREEKGLTQGDVFRSSRIDRAYICRVESGRVNPTLENLYKLANALGVEAWELLK
ncbi:MAG: helix-turn-helix transcriptional regulator [Patescibacteria group bacterium]